MGRKRILGKLIDFLSGREITDTDDERLRQKIARFLVEEKGYAKEQLSPKEKIEFELRGDKIVSMIDLVIRVESLIFLVLKYGPGSIVTRERPALACARTITGYQVPVTVVSNGIDAEVLDTVSGAVIGTGLGMIPDRVSALAYMQKTKLEKISPKKLEAEKSIIAAYDYLEHSLECDDDWCSAG